MCEPATLTTIALATTAVSGGMTAYSQYQQGAATNKYYNYMADNARKEGDYAVKTAEAQSRAYQDQAKIQGKELSKSQAEFNASQRATMAASGVQGVTAEDITSSTFTKEQLDKQLLRYNADVKSWEANTQGQYKKWQSNVQADQYGYQGKAAKYSGKQQAFTTLLSTAAQMAMIGAGGFGNTSSSIFKVSSNQNALSRFGGGVKRVKRF